MVAYLAVIIVLGAALLAVTVYMECIGLMSLLAPLHRAAHRSRLMH